MDKITKGKYVEMAYKMFELDNEGEELMLEMTKEQPERFVFGDEDSMLPAICNAIRDKQADIQLHPHSCRRFRRLSRRTCAPIRPQDV